MAEEKKEQSTAVFKEVAAFFPDNLKKGAFANNVFITHTPEEFFLDFLSVAPPQGSVVARIIMTPSHIKRLIKALEGNLKSYEDTFGEVPEEIKPK